MNKVVKSSLDVKLSWQSVIAWENGTETPSIEELFETTLVFPFIGRIVHVKFFIPTYEIGKGLHLGGNSSSKSRRC